LNEMEWALSGLAYLRKARNSVHEELNEVMNEVRDYNRLAREQPWFLSCKNIIQSLYHYSDEFPDDGRIPGEKYGSPGAFTIGLTEYKGAPKGRHCCFRKMLPPTRTCWVV